MGSLKVKLILFFSLFFFVTSAPANSAPEINEVTGSISEGNSITITGTNFGAHSDNQPNADYVANAWDDLDDGYISSDIFGSDNYGPEYWTNSAEQRTGSSNCARSFRSSDTSFTSVFGDSVTGGAASLKAGTNTTIFVSGWFMLPAASVTLMENVVSEQCKFISSTNNAGCGNQYWNFMGNTRINYEDSRIAENPPELTVGNGIVDAGVWNRFSIELTPTHTYFYCNGKQYSTKTSWQCTPGDLDIYWFRYFGGSDWYVYGDDFYADYTIARVELSENSTWDTTTRKHLEIQPATSWSDSSITITLNQGSFQEGDTVYLYVIDENGVANTNGYPLNIGGGEAANSLPSPGNLEITSP